MAANGFERESTGENLEPAINHDIHYEEKKYKTPTPQRRNPSHPGFDKLSLESSLDSTDRPNGTINRNVPLPLPHGRAQLETIVRTRGLPRASTHPEKTSPGGKESRNGALWMIR